MPCRDIIQLFRPYTVSHVTHLDTLYCQVQKVTPVAISYINVVNISLFHFPVQQCHLPNHIMLCFQYLLARQQNFTVLWKIFNLTVSGVPRNFVREGGSSTNSVEDRGQRERGSGGGSPHSQGFWRQL